MSAGTFRHVALVCARGVLRDAAWARCTYKGVAPIAGWCASPKTGQVRPCEGQESTAHTRAASEGVRCVAWKPRAKGFCEGIPQGTTGRGEAARRAVSKPFRRRFHFSFPGREAGFQTRKHSCAGTSIATASAFTRRSKRAVHPVRRLTSSIEKKSRQRDSRFARHLFTSESRQNLYSGFHRRPRHHLARLKHRCCRNVCSAV